MSSYVPVSSELHQGKRWLRHPNMAFAKSENVAPIFANELVDAIHTLTVAFVKHEDSFILVALMGLRAGENLLVSADGRWANGAYTPASYRTRPFTLLEIPGNAEQQVLCIEEQMLTEGDLGAELFDDEGKISDVVGEIFNLLSHYNATRLLTRDICATLAAHGLFTPWEVVVNDGATEQKLTGLYRVDEEALNALSDEAFLALRKTAALPVVYAHLYSMNNTAPLNNLLQHRLREAEIQKAPAKDEGTFNFAGL